MSEPGETENLLAAIEERIRKLLDQPGLSEARRERLGRILAEVQASRRDDEGGGPGRPLPSLPSG